MAPRLARPVALALLLGALSAQAATLTSPAATSEAVSTTSTASRASSSATTAPASSASPSATAPASLAPEVPEGYLYTLSVRPSAPPCIN